MKRWKWIVLGTVGAAQLVQPDRSPPVNDAKDDLIASTAPPVKVEALLRSACYDCHSNTTRHPWYAYITPVNLWIQESHVDHAREHVNFSAWGTYTAEDREEIAEEAMEMVSGGEMPVESYTWMHDEARLSDADRKALVNYFSATR